MSSSENNKKISQIAELIRHNERRLHKLEVKASLLGYSTPAEIELEIEDIQKRLFDLKAEQRYLQASSININGIKSLIDPVIVFYENNHGGYFVNGRGSTIQLKYPKRETLDGLLVELSKYFATWYFDIELVVMNYVKSQIYHSKPHFELVSLLKFLEDRLEREKGRKAEQYQLTISEQKDGGSVSISTDLGFYGVVVRSRSAQWVKDVSTTIGTYLQPLC